jgi:hypothetical protein
VGDTGASADRMADAASRWLGELEPGQRRRARFEFDATERFVWDYLPGARRGVTLGEMSEPQRAAAMALVASSLSERGAGEVEAIIGLEPVLRELERGTGKDVTRRDPGRYGFAVFGEPDTSAPWSWRVGGHHVAVHVTVAGGRVIGTTPLFLGANPATVPHGPLAGRRALDGEETLARAVLLALSPAQRRIAVVDPVAPPDILSGTGQRADCREVPTGIAGDELDRDGRDALERLIRHYLGRVAPAIAESAWDEVRSAGLESVTFAWAGPDEPGRGHYYAIHGPRLLIEYDNTQNGANHIHAVWRDATNDWGEDLLGAHYRSAHASGQG